MLQFTKLIKTRDRVREFNFTKPSLTADSVFRVDVSDDRGNRIIFAMHKDAEHQWRIVEEDLPKWVYETEESLQEAIADHFQQAWARFKHMGLIYWFGNRSIDRFRLPAMACRKPSQDVQCSMPLRFIYLAITVSPRFYCFPVSQSRTGRYRPYGCIYKHKKWSGLRLPV